MAALVHRRAAELERGRAMIGVTGVDSASMQATESGTAVLPFEDSLLRRSRLYGAVAVVTGGARGIGRAIVDELATTGAKVVINYAHSKEAAEEFVRELRERGIFEVVAVQADVADPEQATALIEKAVERFGRIDVLVNNAGITADHSMKNLTIEEWDRVVRVDLNSCFYTVKAALPYFMRQQWGRVINMSSFVGQEGNFGQANYAAAKAGIIGFTKTAALELARYNVTVNAICPGFIETEMYESIPQAVKEVILKKIPLARVGKPEEVARCVRYLIEDGDYITGQSISINGGIYM
jgi:acetoacetyl-CoA reductase